MPTNAIPASAIIALLVMVAPSFGADPVFSGPQPGESIVPFQTKVVFGDDAGKTIDVLTDESPALTIFVHEVTRPSIGITRLLATYATKLKKLDTHVIFLTDDGPATEAWMKRARHALPRGVSPLISVDGIEGPGVYGLNRHVQVTALVTKDGKVTDNFALVQPSIQADAPKIGKAMAQAVGEKEAPTLKQMGFEPPQRQRLMAQNQLPPQQNAIYRQYMAPVIRGKTKEDVEKAAREVEAYAAKHPWFRNKVHDASSMIVGGGKLANYGQIETARDFLRKWAKTKPAAETAKGNGTRTPDMQTDEGKGVKSKKETSAE